MSNKVRNKIYARPKTRRRRRSLDMLWPECGQVKVFTRTKLWGTCRKMRRNDDNLYSEDD